ncbi:MAG: electron transport complex subunit RsxC [Clostridiales bacterium]|nr:electron transport complex subunit RsxC [Clostridiales bacterium]
MEDYTKFKLKRKEELAPFLKDKDKLFVVACNKCFKEFELGEEPELGRFQEIAGEAGKTVTGCANVDFLCNRTTTEKALLSALPQEAGDVFVISCGLGIQTVADVTDKPVYAASDSISYRGRHGMALTTAKCEACGQCFLNLTGGICPVVDCSKSLTNGQCGGAKNGKCEVDKDMDCGWQMIYERMEKLGRKAELLNQPLQIRDYSKINYKTISQYVKSIREERLDGYYGGVHPSERKEYSEHLSLVKFPDPKTVVIPLSQHTGAPAEPVVAAGDEVKAGQKIGEANGFISSPMHASVSGVVKAVEPRLHPITGAMVLSVVIESDGKNTLHESVKPAGDLEDMSPEQIAAVIREAGIVGMGGAGFPTAVKVIPPKPVDVVLLNGCECEPLLTADHRVMVEYADDILFGLKAVLKASGAEKGIIAIEENKPDAIEILRAKTAGSANIEVAVTRVKYPQGAEKMLIKRILGRSVPSGGLPADIGAIVSNISTVKAISDAIQRGLPLIERVLTVSGERISKPGNYIVKVGTSVKEIIDYCGGVVGDDVTVKMGGPQMGFELKELAVPVVKGTNGIIAIETVVTEPNECIKCGRCADVCPMELKPLYFTKYAGTENWQGFKDQNVLDCIECKCCDTICSSKIPIVSMIKTGKQAIREGK